MTYWHYNALIGKNRVSGRVRASSKKEAMQRGLKAVHARYPNSLVVMLGGTVRPSVNQH